MYEVSEKFIEYCKRHQRTYKNCTITYEDNGETKTINGDKIIKVEISATPYIDYQLIGQAPSKKIHINLRGKDYDLTNKEIQVSTTMYYDDNTSETLGLGTYIISSDYESQVKDECSFTGYDYMIKLDTQYSDEGLEYPCTLQDVLNNLCEQNDLELYSININNGKLQVTGNNFDDTFTYRDVLRQIAQASGTFAYIDRQNKVHVDNLIKVGSTGGTILQFKLQGTLQIDGETTENFKDEITPGYYMQNFQSSRLYGPVNKVQITLTDVEDATYKEDTESIRNNGIQTITINDNFFLGTIEAREYAIQNLWTALYSLRYVPFSAEYLGFPYLEMGDLIQVEELDGTTTESYVFNYVFTYDGGYMGSLETPTITRTQETYPTNSIEEKLGKFGFSVDRANKEISAVAEDVSGVKADLTLKIDKDDNNQIISMINASADVITLNSNRLVINSTNFILTKEGDITATSGTIGGFALGTNTFTANLVSPYEYTQEDLTRVQGIIQGTIEPTYEDYEKYDLRRCGSISTFDSLQIARYVNGTSDFTGTFTLDTNNSIQAIQITNNVNNDIWCNMGIFGAYFVNLTAKQFYVNNFIDIDDNNVSLGKVNHNGIDTYWLSMNNSTGQNTVQVIAEDAQISLWDTNYQNTINLTGETGNVTCVSLTQTSKAEEKKDFEKYEGALKELENIDIYKYHMKNETDDTKKHIGFVIGDKYKYSQEVTSNNNDGVDVYSFVSLCCQAIKELQEEIKELRGKINE